MAIYITGDVHGQEGLTARLRDRALRVAEPDKSDYLIICGDFGCVWDQLRPDGSEPRRERKFLDNLDRKGPTMLFVPGNHENYDRLTGVPDKSCLDSWLYRDLDGTGRKAMLDGYPRKPWHGGTVREIRPSVLMLEDGIFDVCGRKILAVGGAPSHDIDDGILKPTDYSARWEYEYMLAHMSMAGMMFRVEHISWWPQEVPSRRHMDDVLRRTRNATVDAVVTHDMPDSVRSALGFTDDSPMSRFLDEIKAGTAYKDWFCGHYHMDEELPDGIHLMYRGVRQLA